MIWMLTIFRTRKIKKRFMGIILKESYLMRTMMTKEICFKTKVNKIMKTMIFLIMSNPNNLKKIILI